MSVKNCMAHHLQTFTTCRHSQRANAETSLTANRLQKSTRGLQLECCPAAAFENIVQALYTNVVPKPKSQCSKSEQLGVSFTAGYLAGILCAAISHPADNLVSKMNASKVCTSSMTTMGCSMLWYTLWYNTLYTISSSALRLPHASVLDTISMLV